MRRAAIVSGGSRKSPNSSALEKRESLAGGGGFRAGRQRQGGYAERHQEEVHQDLRSGGEIAGEAEGVEVAEEKDELEEEHAGDPDSGGASESREEGLGEDRLDDEEQGGTAGYGAGVEEGLARLELRGPGGSPYQDDTISGFRVACNRAWVAWVRWVHLENVNLCKHNS